MRVILSFSSQTDIGRRRALNEDTVFAADGLFVVCDGMGGYKAGDAASQLATEVITMFVNRSGEDTEITWPYGFRPDMSFDGNRLRTAIKLANRAVFRKGASSEDYSGMGTTVVAMIASPSRAQMTFAHVGDSRIYLAREGIIEQLTRDDSWANVWGDKTMKHVLTKALGAQEDVDFEVRDRELVVDVEVGLVRAEFRVALGLLIRGPLILKPLAHLERAHARHLQGVGEADVVHLPGHHHTAAAVREAGIEETAIRR